MSSESPRQNGAVIRSLRIKAGFKPGAFAEKVGLSYTHLNNIERERKEASIEGIYRIAAALDVPPADLVRDPACLEAAS